jgi:predicted ATP-dependent serine protease
VERTRDSLADSLLLLRVSHRFHVGHGCGTGRGVEVRGSGERSKGKARRVSKLQAVHAPTTTMNAASQSLPSPAPSQSASALLRSSRRAARFSSNCPALDALLSPASSGKRVGLAQGSVLEIMGTPGIGKTKMALGFVISARFEAITEETDCEVLVIGESRADV